MKVSIGLASAADRTCIEGMFQLYAHDFSQWEPEGSGRFVIDARGGFGDYPYMDSYWREPDRAPLLFHAAGEVAGFALVNAESHSGLPLGFNMAEFFVARKFRGRGVGVEAARLLLSGAPGLWEVAVAARNLPALRFWPRAIKAAGAIALQRLEGDGERWTGPIWRFRTDAPPGR